MSVLEPFRIEVSADEVEELRRRVRRTRWPDQLPGVGWDYGVERDYLTRLAEYWADGYDWRRQEAALNAVPQFTTEIDGARVHFLHARSAEPGAVPMLLSHGWPSTVADFLPLVRPLTDPAASGAAAGPAFHLVMPSLPGFGFSGPTRDRGWGVTRIAGAWTRLMDRLGYQRYLVLGADYGSLVAGEVARAAPDRVRGVHLHGLITTASADAPEVAQRLSAGDRARLAEEEQEWSRREGYSVEQRTRPQTVGYALTDSPVGLLAWMLEWFVDYDADRRRQSPVDRDAILTDVSVFWFTRTAGSAARLYKETSETFRTRPPAGVPTAVTVFPGDYSVRPVVEQEHRVVRWTEYDRGGHFAALQAPDLLIDDLRAFGSWVADRD